MVTGAALTIAMAGRRRPAPRRFDEHQAPDGPGHLARHPPSQACRCAAHAHHARTRKGPRKQAVKLNAPPGKA
jgi:hypothetical protein